MDNKRLKLLDILMDELPDDTPWRGNIKGLLEGLISRGVTVQEWIPSNKQKPTKEDGDKYGRVLVVEHGFITCAYWQAPVNFPDDFPYWMPMPKPPKK